MERRGEPAFHLQQNLEFNVENVEKVRAVLPGWGSEVDSTCWVRFVGGVCPSGGVEESFRFSPGLSATSGFCFF